MTLQAWRTLRGRFGGSLGNITPDVSDDPDGERKFKEIAEAYRTLKFAALRSSPDQPLWRSRQFIDASERVYDAWLTWLQFVYWWSGWGAWWSPDILRQERR